MECRDVLEAIVDRLSWALPPGRSAELDDHLSTCPACRAQAAAAEASWRRLGEDPDAVLTSEFERETLAMLEAAVLRRRVSPIRNPKSAARNLLRLVAALAAGGVGFLIARGLPRKAAGAAKVPIASSVTADVSRVSPYLSGNPRLANVAYQPVDATGKIGVSFDVTTRYTVTGRPEEKPMSDLLAHLVSGAGVTEGARSGAIDLVSENYRRAWPPSSRIVAVLVQTLKADRNPGVRKKAAEALAQLPPTSEIRDAFVAALADANPSIRIVAVEALARMAVTLKDPSTIETLRQKARDETENGYVRVKAASALRHIDL